MKHPSSGSIEKILWRRLGPCSANKWWNTSYTLSQLRVLNHYPIFVPVPTEFLSKWDIYFRQTEPPILSFIFRMLHFDMDKWSNACMSVKFICFEHYPCDSKRSHSHEPILPNFVLTRFPILASKTEHLLWTKKIAVYHDLALHRKIEITLR